MDREHEIVDRYIAFLEKELEESKKQVLDLIAQNKYNLEQMYNITSGPAQVASRPSSAIPGSMTPSERRKKMILLDRKLYKAAQEASIRSTQGSEV